MDAGASTGRSPLAKGESRKCGRGVTENFGNAVEYDKCQNPGVCRIGQEMRGIGSLVDPGVCQVAALVGYARHCGEYRSRGCVRAEMASVESVNANP